MSLFLLWLPAEQGLANGHGTGFAESGDKNATFHAKVGKLLDLLSSVPFHQVRARVCECIFLNAQSWVCVHSSFNRNTKALLFCQLFSSYVLPKVGQGIFSIVDEHITPSGWLALARTYRHGHDLLQVLALH